LPSFFDDKNFWHLCLVSKYYSYIKSAEEITSLYKGKEPFSYFIKEYFRQNKKFGSKDRKIVSHACYCYYRLGASFTGYSFQQKVLIALFLCSNKHNELIEHLQPAWNESITASLNQKLSLLNIPAAALQIFTFNETLSEGINAAVFSISHLQQPDLFLRIRPQQKENVLKKLQAINFNYTLKNGNCIALSNNTKAQDVLTLNKEVVVQDESSQKVAEFLKQCWLPPGNIKVWDCCAASGGKSILAKDVLHTIELTVSDIRETIIYNLQQRFKEAEIEQYKSFVADIASPNFKPATSFYDLVIADVPCTGSGTWGRTPEQLVYFNEAKTAQYAWVQKNIACNVIASIKKDGYLLYITCSVFKKENEDNIVFLLKEFPLELIDMHTIIGYNNKADTMFAALLRKQV
jgi:16S rRNA (cytosine967-C5)-methyltransferase